MLCACVCVCVCVCVLWVRVCVCVCVCVCVFIFALRVIPTFNQSHELLHALPHLFAKRAAIFSKHVYTDAAMNIVKLTWLVLGGYSAARSHRVEHLTAL